MKKEKVVAILLGRLELKLKADSNTGGWIVLEALTCCWNCGLLCLSVAVLSFSMSRTSSIAGVVTCSVQWKKCFCVWFTLFYYRVCHHSSRTTNLKRRVGVSDWEKKKQETYAVRWRLLIIVLFMDSLFGFVCLAALSLSVFVSPQPAF